jgi:hypothetical protein
MPWHSYIEDEVQAILYEYYASKGYDVNWYHRDDKRMEKAAACDLLCKKNEETIGIAVKKRPCAEDAEQVKRLARKGYSRHVYVYVDDPTLEFRQSMKHYKNKVDFWNPQFVENMLQNDDIGLSILYDVIFSNSYYLTKVVETVDFTKKWSEENSLNIVDSSEHNPLPQLIRLKDEAVLLHKSCELLLGILEEKEMIRGTNSKALFALCLHTVDYYGRALGSFLDTWKALHSKNPIIMKKVHDKYGHTSPFKNLWSYEYWSKGLFFYRPGVLKGKLKEIPLIETDEYEAREDKYVELFEKEGKEYERTPFFMEAIRENFLRKQITFFLCLEDIVDMMLDLQT